MDVEDFDEKHFQNNSNKIFFFCELIEFHMYALAH